MAAANAPPSLCLFQPPLLHRQRCVAEAGKRVRGGERLRNTKGSSASKSCAVFLSLSTLSVKLALVRYDCGVSRRVRDAKDKESERKDVCHVHLSSGASFLSLLATSHLELQLHTAPIALDTCYGRNLSDSSIVCLTLSPHSLRTFSSVFRRSASSRRCIKRSPRRLVDKLAGDCSTFSDIVTVCSAERQNGHLTRTHLLAAHHVLARWLTAPFLITASIIILSLPLARALGFLPISQIELALCHHL